MSLKRTPKQPRVLMVAYPQRPMTERTWIWWIHSLVEVEDHILYLWSQMPLDTHAYHGEGHRQMPLGSQALINISKRQKEASRARAPPTLQIQVQFQQLFRYSYGDSITFFTLEKLREGQIACRWNAGRAVQPQILSCPDTVSSD